MQHRAPFLLELRGNRTTPCGDRSVVARRRPRRPSGTWSRVFWAGVFAFAGCSANDRLPDDGGGEGPSTEELAAIYSPKQLKVLSFTKPKSFDGDLIPDGILASVRTLDSTGDEVKAYGKFMFELYDYQPGTADRRGERIGFWDPSLRSPEDQRRFWDRFTRAYEFELLWEGGPIRPQRRYILAASFQAPGGQRLFDEYEFDFSVDRQEILEAMKPSQ